MLTDPIADLFTRIRNAAMAGHKDVLIPHSKAKEAIVKALVKEGYLSSYDVREDNNGFKQIRVIIKYTIMGNPAFRVLKRESKPGLRKYFKVDNIPHILNGAGIALLSTNLGVMTDRQARADRVGGELLATVY